MKLSEKVHSTPQKGANRNAFRGGSYSLMVTGLVLALVIVVNLLVNTLPPSLTRYDISSSKLYSVTSNTKMVLNDLQEDVTIYWIVQNDQEDGIIENLLEQYESLSDHIKVVKKNPDVYPTFASQYTTETVQNNSLVVEHGDRSRYIALEDIYLSQPDVANQSINASFDGEGAITSAIDYVVNEEQPLVYVLEGHGEAELPDAFADQIQKANIDTAPLSLLKVDAIPEQAACVMLYAPETDLSPEEVEMLEAYTRAGGKLFVAAGPTENGILPNLYSLLDRYHITTRDGVIVESDRAGFAFRQPYALIPHLESAPLTDPLIEEHYFPIFPIAQGLTIGEEVEGVTVTPLLSVSRTAFSKQAGYELDTYEKEEGDVDGPFTLAVDIADDNGGEIIWFASSVFLEDLYNAYSSGANMDLAMNALSALVGESEAMAIRSKSLNYNYLTISESAGAMLKVVMIGVIPLAYLAAGVFVVTRRKKKLSAAAR